MTALRVRGSAMVVRGSRVATLEPRAALPGGRPRNRTVGRNDEFQGRFGRKAMSHDHGHRHGRSGNRRRLALTLALAAGYMVAEVVGGLLTNSLALLADAGHML